MSSTAPYFRQISDSLVRGFSDCSLQMDMQGLVFHLQATLNGGLAINIFKWMD
jgi:hypothetical protein